MECECFNALKKIEEKLNSEYHSGYAYLDSLKDSGELDGLLESYNVPNLFRNELRSFLNLYFDNSYHSFPNLRMLCLHETGFVSVFRRYGYILSLFLNCVGAYRDFPLFLYYSCLYYDFKIVDMKLSTIESELNNCMNLKYSVNPSSGFKKVFVEVDNKPVGFYTDYSLYDEKLQNNNINYNDKTEFFIWAEYSVFLDELNELRKFSVYNADFIVRWVSRYHGDGYGYDILSFDPASSREKLIEVKSGKSRDIIITKEELKRIYRCVKYNSCDYYIYKCFFNVESNNLEYYVLKFDLENKFFVDIYRGDKYYISPYFYFKDGKEKVEASVEKEDVYIKSKML